MISTDENGGSPTDCRGTYAAAQSAMAERFRQEYEVQIRRRSCPSCGETPVSAPATAFEAEPPQRMPADGGDD